MEALYQLSYSPVWVWSSASAGAGRLDRRHTIPTFPVIRNNAEVIVVDGTRSAVQLIEIVRRIVFARPYASRIGLRRSPSSMTRSTCSGDAGLSTSTW